MNNLITLEDLNNFLSNKLENEFKNFNFEKKMQEIDAILNKYDLSSDEYEYANPIKISLESASHQKTMINVNKAKRILLKIKK
jgi:hypothetical protein